MRPAGAGQSRGGGPVTSMDMRFGSAVQTSQNPANGLAPQLYAQGGQLGLAGHGAVQNTPQGQLNSRPSNLPSNPWPNGPQSQGRDIVQGHMQQQRQQQHQQEAQGQSGSRQRRKAKRKQAAEQREQQQQFPPPPVPPVLQAQQQQYPLPPAVMLDDAARSQAGSTAAVPGPPPARSRWDTGSQPAPWQPQQQIQQLDLQTAGQQLQLQQPQQLQPPTSLPILVLGKGHEHIPVLQLGQPSPGDPSLALVLDRLDSAQARARQPHLQHMQGPAVTGTGAIGTSLIAVPLPPAGPPPAAGGAGALSMQAPAPPPPAAVASAPMVVSQGTMFGSQQSQQMSLQLQHLMMQPAAMQNGIQPPLPPSVPQLQPQHQKQQQPQQQQQQLSTAGVGIGDNSTRPPWAKPVAPPAEQLLQAAEGNLQALLDVVQTLTKDPTQIAKLTPQVAMQAVTLITAAAQQQQQQQESNEDEPERPKPLKHSGVRGLCKWLQQVVSQITGGQLLEVLECLSALASAGYGPVTAGCINDVVAALAQSGALDDADSFLTAASAVTTLAAAAAAGGDARAAAAPAGASQLLSESVLRKLFRDDADGGCRLLLEVLIGLHLKGLQLPNKPQDLVLKTLLDQLPRFTPPQLAALLACHSQLGLNSSSSYGKLLRKTAAEYLKRPVHGASVDMLLGVMRGLADGGYATVRELPHQLLPKLCDDLQPLLHTCTPEQLLSAPMVLAQLGCLKLNSPKQQQLVDTLLQQLQQQRFQTDVYLGFNDVLQSLHDISADLQHQQGLMRIVRELTAMQDNQQQAVQQANAVAVLKLVAGLQLSGQFVSHADQLQGRVLSAIVQLCEGIGKAETAAAAAGHSNQQQPPQQQDEERERLHKHDQQEQLQEALGNLSLQELVAVVEVVMALPKPTADAGSSSSSNNAGRSANSSEGMPYGGAEVALLLRALLQSEVLLFKRVNAAMTELAAPAAAAARSSTSSDGDAAAGLPPPPPAAAVAAQQQQQQQRTRAGTPPLPPPPPPPAAAAAAAARPATPPPPPPDSAAAAADGSLLETPAAAAVVPVVFESDGWDSLARLLLLCVDWYGLEDTPQQLMQLVLEVVESQAMHGGVHSCSPAAAVDLLWGLAVSGALLLELWDALAIALDKADVGLSQEQLQKVFEAYCLVVLCITGPAPRPVPAGQLAAAGEAFWAAVVAPVADQRAQLQQALAAAELLPAGEQLTQLGDGHLMLFDVVVPESHQAWVIASSRSPLVTAAAELLLSRYDWTVLQISTAQLGPPSSSSSSTEACKQTLQQVVQVAQLLPKIAALLKARNNPQQQQEQQPLQLDAASLAGLSKVVDHLRSAIRAGTLVAALPPAQVAMLKHIADMHKGPVAKAAPVLPAWGSARLQRLAQQAAAAAAEVEQSAGESEEPESDMLQSDQIPDENLDPNAMDAQELFVHNRVYLTVDDPWWFCQRLLVPDDPPAAAAAGATAAQAAAGTAAAAAGLTGETLEDAKAAAAAALVVKAQWQQQELAARAAENASRAAAGLPSLEEEAAAAAAQPMTADRSASPDQRQQQPKRRRYWRESRSRSRSRSVSTSYSTDAEPSRGEDHDEQQQWQPEGRAAAARYKQAGSSSSGEEGAVSSEEEGQVSDDGDLGSPRQHWTSATVRSRSHSRSRSQSWSRSRSRSPNWDRDRDAAMPQNFAGRGVGLDYAARQRQRRQQQPQLPEGRKKLARGRKRGRSSSSSRSRDSSSRSRSRSRGRGWDRYAPYQLRRSGSSSSSGGSRGRSRSASPIRRRSDTGGRPRSPVHGHHDHHMHEYQPAAADAADQQQQLYQAAVLAAAAAEAAAAAQSQTAQQQQLLQQQQQFVLQQQQQQQLLLQAQQQQQMLIQQQQQQQVQLMQQQQQLVYAKQAQWLPRFAALPKSQQRLAQLLRNKVIWPNDLRESALSAAMQLNDETLLNALKLLEAAILDRRERDKQKAARAAAEGKEMPKHKRHTGEVNGKLVSICRNAGATVPSKNEKASSAFAHTVAAAAPTVGMGAFGTGGFGGFSAAATAAAPGVPAAAAPGAVGYMYVNGMLVPVSAAAAAAAVAGGYGYGSAAAAAGVGRSAGAKAASGKAKQPRAANPTAAAAAGASGSSVSRSANASSGKQQQQQQGGGKGTGKAMNQYWEALCSGLGADGDQYSDVEDEGPGAKKTGGT